MDSKRISVIIPSYKPKEYLWQCLDSMISQTYPKELYEVILVLNGCCEPWKSDIEDYINQKVGGLDIKFLQTDTPGVSNARNMGIDVAKGEYITFIDDDDYVSSSYLEGLVAKAAPDTLALAYPFVFDDGNERDQAASVITKTYEKYSPKGIQPFQNALDFFHGPCMKLIHSKCIGNNRFDNRFVNGEDSLFMFVISDSFKYVDFANCDSIYYRRNRDGSASHSQSTMQIIKNGYKLIKAYHAQYWNKEGRIYDFRFYITRILGAMHTIINGLIKRK